MSTQADRFQSREAHAVGRRLSGFLVKGGVLPLLLLLCVIIFQAGNPRFLSQANLLNLLQQGIYLLLIALGQMAVLLSGGFDLSVGANVALTSIIGSNAMVAVSNLFPDSDAPAVLAGFAATFAVGLFAGLANGLGVSVLGVNPFIVTLATASIFQGITLVVSQGLEVSGLPSTFIYDIGSGFFLGLPVAVLLALPAVVVVFVLVHRTRFGRHLFATGSNPRAAVVAGVSVPRILTATYVLCALITSFSGFLLTARVSSGEPLLGAEFTLRSITAAVIGGCSLRGGQGGVGGTILGVAFITVRANGMDLLRLGSTAQMIVIGLVLVVAVLLDRRRARQAAGK
jgi:ribose/xylose/arabinose/galactoside ABC-type transport system permease subunit